MVRHKGIPQRKRIFIGCEGESEQSYARLLERIGHENLGLHITVDPVVVAAGDPLAIVEMAARKAKERAAKHGPYALRALLLDSDKVGLAPTRDAQIAAIVTRAKLHLIWQHTCHEALLLRHLPHCSTLRPPSTNAAATEILKHWPDYAKPMPAARLALRIRLDHVLCAAKSEPELYEFLHRAKFFS